MPSSASDVMREALRAELNSFAKEVLCEQLAQLKKDLVTEILAAQDVDTARQSLLEQGVMMQEPEEFPGDGKYQLLSDGRFDRWSVSQGLELHRGGVVRHQCALMTMDAAEEPEHVGETSRVEDRIFQSCSHQIATSSAFTNVIIGAILLSLVSFVVQTDCMARNWSHQPPRVFFATDVAFQVVFTAEIVTRICAYGKEFFLGREQYTNWFDLSLVVLQGIEICLHVAHIRTGGAFVMSLRVLRISRILRIGRILHLLPAMHMLVVSIVSCLRSLLWILLFVLLTTGSFAVVLTQIVTDHKADAGEEEIMSHQRELEEYFGSVGQSTFKLYQTISDGAHWSELADPLMEYCSPWTGGILIVYSAFVTFALMNVVTAFFVETALSDGQEDVRVQVSAALWDEFNSSHKVIKGEISEEEFMAHIHTPAMKEYFNKLDIDAEKALDMNFFRLIDQDRNGSVTLKELIHGCTHLMGGAKSVEIVALIQEFREEGRKNEMHRDEVEQRLNQLCHRTSASPLWSRQSRNSFTDHQTRKLWL